MSNDDKDYEKFMEALKHGAEKIAEDFIEEMGKTGIARSVFTVEEKEVEDFPSQAICCKCNREVGPSELTQERINARNGWVNCEECFQKDEPRRRDVHYLNLLNQRYS